MNTETKPTFAEQASKASWMIPLINFGVLFFGNSMGSANPKKTFIIIGLTIIALTILGVLLGLSGILLGKKNKIEAAIKPGIIGLMINITIAVILFKFVYPVHQRQKEYANVEQKLNETKKETFEKIIKNEEINPDEFANVANSELSKLAEHEKGEKQRVMHVLIEFNKFIQHHALEVNKTQKELYENDIWNYSSLKSESDYMERYSLLDSAYNASEKCVSMIENIEKHLDSFLKKENISNDLITRAKSNFLLKFNKEATSKMYKTCSDQYLIMKDVLKLLQDNKQTWDVVNNELRFNNDTVLKQFNSMFEKLEKMDQDKINIIKEMQASI